ncbi:hypothetical protein BDY24DRAFT_38394 [Mrakia frigida]|uniref:uncharacterized protein n=1 Tax=Mrakia frigida TaxID=29902 RepID=UPI003FCC050B
MTLPPTDGLTREEFLTILSERGLLVNSLPSSALPHILHDYLQARRTHPRFSVLAYTLHDISANQPRQLEAANAFALAQAASTKSTSLIVSDPNAPWTERLSDWWEENVGARMDGRENKIDLVKKAEREREKVEGVVVKVLEPGKEGEGKVLRSGFEQEVVQKRVGEPVEEEGRRLISAAGSSSTTTTTTARSKSKEGGRKEKVKVEV